MRYITFDIETIGEIVNGDLSNQEVTVVGIHDSATNEYASFLKDELHALWPVFEQADALIGYNSDHFDIPILNKYYPGDLTKIKSIDLLKEIRNVLGRRLKLDNVAEATLGTKKTGTGLEAIAWWAEGKVEQVRQYCLDDVKITRALYEYMRDHGSVKYRDFDGLRELKINTSHWSERPTRENFLTHTLPF